MLRHRGARACVSLGCSACGKKKPRPPAPPPPPPRRPARPPPPPPPPPPAPPRERRRPPPTEDEIFARKSLDELNTEHPLDDVFFALDSAQVVDEAAAGAAEGRRLDEAVDQSTKVMIEGHCDSRGSAEYNLALGDRRAGAVRDYLVSLGVPADRIQTRQQGQGAAVLQRGERSLLAAEPPRLTSSITAEVGRRPQAASGFSGRPRLSPRWCRRSPAPPRRGSAAAMIGRPTTR